MAEMESFRRCVNPLVLNLQKMELELTCPICLKLLSIPTLLPCNHISCSLCVTARTVNSYDCPICKVPFHYQDLKPAAHIEAMVNIYRSMNSSVSAILTQQPKLDISDQKPPSGGSPGSENKSAVDKLEDDQIHNMIGPKSRYTHSCAPVYRNMDDGKFSNDGETGELVINESNNEVDKVGVDAYTKQKEPCSSQSSGDLRDSYYETNGPRCEPRSSRSPVKGSFRGDPIVGMNQEDQCRESKRQKLDNADDVDKCTNFKWEQNNTACMGNCAFCHTSRSTEASGPMLHYLDGEPVPGDQARQANVLHVHEKCIEWAPQVFFSGDTAMNLEPELARASKIKCSSCGLKGAALGCYAKSCRRSFHVPCAYEIPECRWDPVSFLLLCPAHSSHKLPCDRSKTKDKIKAKRQLSSSNLLLDDLTSSSKKQSDEVWAASSSLTREWMICGSALSSKDKEILDDFVNLTGVSVANNWKPNVTHVIAATDERGACGRTLKVLMAILGGKWVLTVDWLQACLEARHPVSEEPYEISYDVHGSFDGPRTGRIRAMQKAPKLFASLAFYFSGHFMPYYKGHLEDLILAAGGSILKKNELSEASLILYSTEPPQGSDPNDLAEVIKRRKEEAEELATTTGSRVIAHTWLLDSIAACSVQLPI
ncbi:BRCA1-associated RING domain protein 1 [Typha angustifolia]|uniref:BRCA1-associated RING domain protein 1 n=1 Tax=Typha angustifolia TaxID=59011 RepID=UPI003C2D2E1A